MALAIHRDEYYQSSHNYPRVLEESYHNPSNVVEKVELVEIVDNSEDLVFEEDDYAPRDCLVDVDSSLYLRIRRILEKALTKAPIRLSLISYYWTY